jgi:hypothetical protein
MEPRLLIRSPNIMHLRAAESEDPSDEPIVSVDASNAVKDITSETMETENA